MSLFDEIFKYKSISVVGMAKNTGKTEAMKALLEACRLRGHRIGITSIGVDGESTDQVTGTQKPEIVLAEGSLFVTSEKYFKERKMSAEVLAVSQSRSALGRLVTARAVTPGKIILSGPVSTARIREVIDDLLGLGAETVFVDGALSRKSLGSPSVTEGLVLATGAALSPNLHELVRKTEFVCDLVRLPRYNTSMLSQLLEIEQGIFAIDGDELYDLGISSAFLLEKKKAELFSHGHCLFVSGAVGDKLLEMMRLQPEISDTTLVIKDFTKVFASQSAFRAFCQKGGKMQVLLRPHLLGVCVNPWSPSGYVMDSEKLQAALTEALGLPVYDVKKRNSRLS